MHERLEIIMPPTDDVEAAVAGILEPFAEGVNVYGFYDWYSIGGRWSGDKMCERLDQDLLSKFQKELVTRKITVSPVRCGKQTLSPDTQIPEVDALWREYFPDGGDVCPLFDHYKGSMGDVCRLSDLPRRTQASRVMIMEPFDEDGRIRLASMRVTKVFDGTCYQGTTWDGNVQSMITKYANEAPTQKPQDDWLVVTVDCHL